jgi:6-phosphofructokinase 2
MIHTVTVNPALDLTYRIPEIKFDDTVRANTVYRAAGGKGINVSRVAARLAHPTVAMGFIGGRSGDEIEELLRQEGVRTWFTRQQTPTRTNAILQDDTGSQIRVSGPGAHVTPEEVESLRSSIFDLKTPNFIVLSGSLLRGMPGDFYVQLIAQATLQGIKTAADADGDTLRDMVKAGAYIIKPNKYELERLAEVRIANDHDVLNAAQGALEQGVRVVLASLGPDGAILATSEGAWKATPPKVKVDSAVGSGDSMLAGALVSRAQGASWPEVLRWSVACGTATATTPGTELCYASTIHEILPQVALEPLRS